MNEWNVFRKGKGGGNRKILWCLLFIHYWMGVCELIWIEGNNSKYEIPIRQLKIRRLHSLWLQKDRKIDRLNGKERKVQQEQEEEKRKTAAKAEPRWVMVWLYRLEEVASVSSAISNESNLARHSNCFTNSSKKECPSSTAIHRVSPFCVSGYDQRASLSTCVLLRKSANPFYAWIRLGPFALSPPRSASWLFVEIDWSSIEDECNDKRIKKHHLKRLV